MSICLLGKNADFILKLLIREIELSENVETGPRLHVVERTQAGLKAATVRGRKGGRKPVVPHKNLAQARAHISDGLTVREAAARLKVSKTNLYKALRDQKPN